MQPELVDTAPLWLTSSTRIAPASRGFVPAPAASSRSSSSRIPWRTASTASRGSSDGNRVDREERRNLFGVGPHLHLDVVARSA
jgi:hypothetical protein